MLLLFRHSAKAVQQNAHVSVKWPGVSVRLLNVKVASWTDQTTDLYHHLLGKQGGGGGVAATSAGQEDSKEERQKKCAESGGLKQNENFFASYCGIFSNFLHAAITTDLIPQWIMLHIIFRVNPLKKNVWTAVTVGTVTLSAIPIDVIVSCCRCGFQLRLAVTQTSSVMHNLAALSNAQYSCAMKNQLRTTDCIEPEWLNNSKKVYPVTTSVLCLVGKWSDKKSNKGSFYRLIYSDGFYKHVLNSCSRPNVILSAFPTALEARRDSITVYGTSWHLENLQKSYLESKTEQHDTVCVCSNPEKHARMFFAKYFDPNLKHLGISRHTWQLERMCKCSLQMWSTPTWFCFCSKVRAHMTFTTCDQSPQAAASRSNCVCCPLIFSF